MGSQALWKCFFKQLCISLGKYLYLCGRKPSCRTVDTTSQGGDNIIIGPHDLSRTCRNNIEEAIGKETKTL